MKKCFQEKKCHVWKRNVGEKENVMFEPNGKEKSWKKDILLSYVKPREKLSGEKKKQKTEWIFFLCVKKISTFFFNQEEKINISCVKLRAEMSTFQYSNIVMLFRITLTIPKHTISQIVSYITHNATYPLSVITGANKDFTPLFSRMQSNSLRHVNKFQCVKLEELPFNVLK